MEWGLLRGLSEDDRRSVLAAARRRRYRRREVIFHEGDPGDTLHLIAKGRVAVHVSTPGGDVSMLSLLVAGEAFGELALLAEHPVRTATVTALEPTETMSLHRDAFDDLRRRHPAVDRLVVDVLARQVVRLSAQLLDVTFSPVDKRVLRRLADLAEIYGDGAAPVVVPLTQTDIAGLAAASRPRVNEVLRRAEDDGLLTLGRGRIELHDLAALARKAR